MGQMLALSYVRLMFGTEHVAGQPLDTVHSTLNLEDPCPYDSRQSVRVELSNSSLAVLSRALTVFLLLDWYGATGFASVMIVHGLWYDDRFDFHYDEAHYQRQATDSDTTSFKLDDGPENNPQFKELSEDSVDPLNSLEAEPAKSTLLKI